MLIVGSVALDEHPNPFLQRASIARGLHRDWPQGRALLITSEIGNLTDVSISFNFEDHLLLVANAPIASVHGGLRSFLNLADAIAEVREVPSILFPVFWIIVQNPC